VGVRDDPPGVDPNFAPPGADFYQAGAGGGIEEELGAAVEPNTDAPGLDDDRVSRLHGAPGPRRAPALRG
jgi:hypothetical protein